MPDAAVVLRSADPELQLQALRTAVSLALGDRPATVYVFGDGGGVLASAEDSEAGRCLSALVEAGIQVLVEAGPGPGTDGTPPVSRQDLLEGLSSATFQQTF